MSDGGRHGIRDLVELFDDIMQVVEQNEGKIRKLTGNDGHIDISEQNNLTEVSRHDDRVIITMETTEDFSSIDVEHEDGTYFISMGGQTYAVKVPVDIIPKKTSAELNNGVLTVVIPRDN